MLCCFFAWIWLCGLLVLAGVWVGVFVVGSEFLPVAVIEVLHF